MDRLEEGIAQRLGKVMDMTGKKCSNCSKGKYKETCMEDDRYGTLHCNKCNFMSVRYKVINEN